jgi:hypothetical protein
MDETYLLNLKAMVRKINLSALLLLFICLPSLAQWHAEVETGIALEGYNDVRIPNEQGTLFSFRDDFEIQGPVIPFRLRVGYTFGQWHHVSALFAPLSISYEGNAPRDIRFQNTLFEEGAPIVGFYKFNSYRITYRYVFFQHDLWRLGVGVTGKIRDARISLTSGEVTDKKDDIGFVPLLHLFARFQPGNFALQLKGDGWAVKQGRAFDFAFTAQYRVMERLWVFAGYRFIEGGADVDEVYNFTFISSIMGGVSWRIE